MSYSRTTTTQRSSLLANAPTSSSRLYGRPPIRNSNALVPPIDSPSRPVRRPRNSNAQSIAEPTPSRNTGNQPEQALTTFRHLREAEVTGGYFVNTIGDVNIHSGGPSRQILSNHRNVDVGSSSNTRPTCDCSNVATPRSSQNAEYDIYYNELLVKKRGSPLWEPGPNMLLPTEYRRNGVSMGDVGILYRTGDFAFLFNIFLPADHEINEGRVPNGFIPLDKSKVEKSMKKSVVYDRGSCLRSSSLRQTDSSDFTFQTTGSEGAVLVMPDGAISEDFRSYKLVEKYVAANAKSWYEYVESDDCGMQTENGDIRVVVGMDKVSSWGMATFENVDIEDPLRFEFKEEERRESQVRTYKWDRTVAGRAGPPEEEIRDLLQEPNTSPLRNQCVFVRTLNVSVAGKVRDELAAYEVRSSCFRDSHSDLGQHGTPSGRQNENPQVGLTVSHPSKLLNNYLLEKCPNAEIVITKDSDWMSVITEDDATTPSFEDICARVLASHVIREKDGIVTLKKREMVFGTGSATNPYVITSLAHQRTTSDDALPTANENDECIIGRLFLKTPEDRRLTDSMGTQNGAIMEEHRQSTRMTGPCDENSRVKILADFKNWVDDVSSGSQNFFWLTEQSGCGKSSIAASLTRYCKDSGTLGAQFFFNRNNEATTNPRCYFVCQMADDTTSDQTISKTINNIIKRAPSVLDEITFNRALGLFVGAVSAACDLDPSKTVVIAIDGLDETRRDKHQDTCCKRNRRCDGEPGSICTPCLSSGRGAMCTWESNFVPRNRRENLVTGLPKQIETFHDSFKLSDLFDYYVQTIRSQDSRLERSDFLEPSCEFHSDKEEDNSQLLYIDTELDEMPVARRNPPQASDHTAKIFHGDEFAVRKGIPNSLIEVILPPRDYSTAFSSDNGSLASWSSDIQTASKLAVEYALLRSMLPLNATVLTLGTKGIKSVCAQISTVTGLLLARLPLSQTAPFMDVEVQRLEVMRVVMPAGPSSCLGREHVAAPRPPFYFTRARRVTGLTEIRHCTDNILQTPEQDLELLGSRFWPITPTHSDLCCRANTSIHTLTKQDHFGSHFGIVHPSLAMQACRGPLVIEEGFVHAIAQQEVVTDCLHEFRRHWPTDLTAEIVTNVVKRKLTRLLDVILFCDDGRQVTVIQEAECRPMGPSQDRVQVRVPMNLLTIEKQFQFLSSSRLDPVYPLYDVIRAAASSSELTAIACLQPRAITPSSNLFPNFFYPTLYLDSLKKTSCGGCSTELGLLTCGIMPARSLL